MIASRAIIPHLSFVVAATLSATASLIQPARAACGDEARVQCRVEFESITAVVRSGDGFTAAGQIKGSPSPGVALLHLTRAGEVRGSVLPVPLPGNLPTDRPMVAEPRKLIALPNGDVVLLNQIAFTEGAATKQVAWAARIAPNGRVLWSRPYSDNSASIIFHSGYYDASGERLVIVGRRTAGPDPASRCEIWSQSLVMTLLASSGQPTAPNLTTFGEQARSFTNRQAIYDIAPDDKAGSFLITGFSTAKHGENDALCQDNIFVATLGQVGNRWIASQVQSVGSNVANEVAFAIKATGDGSYLLAGYGRDQVSGAPAAQIYRFKPRPFTIEGLLNVPYPQDGSDKTGGDRYRTIVSLAEKRRFLAAGSVSAAAQAPNKAAWQVVSADLKTNDPVVVFNSPGSSDIFDTVLSADGRIFAVGRWVDEGRNVGWTGFIGSPGSADAPIASERRRPDSRLPRLSSLPASDGMTRIPSAALSSGAAYFERDLAAGSQIDLAFSVPASGGIKISAYPEFGRCRPDHFRRQEAPGRLLQLQAVSDGADVRYACARRAYALDHSAKSGARFRAPAGTVARHQSRGVDQAWSAFR